MIAAVLAEGAMHPPKLRRAQDVAMLARSIGQSNGATALSVGITAKDGVPLHGWWLVPKNRASRAVIMCHGVADSAMGSMGFSGMFLLHGYAVLTPESRGHGETRGITTYGVREATDVVQWVDWTRAHGAVEVYGLGESLGGAILLQSLAKGADFRAVVAESAYASFTEVANDRVGKVVGRLPARVLVWEATLYARLRYGVDLTKAEPSMAVKDTAVPILLIHGAADYETMPKHSREIAAGNKAIQVWMVPGAFHTGAYAAAPEEFESRVLGWFQMAESGTK